MRAKLVVSALESTRKKYVRVVYFDENIFGFTALILPIVVRTHVYQKCEIRDIFISYLAIQRDINKIVFHIQYRTHTISNNKLI